MDFKVFANALSAKFTEMQKQGVFVVDIDENTIWELYLKSFPIGTNKVLFDESRSEYDCDSCKNVIKRIGGTVIVKDGKLESIWNIESSNPTYQAVIDNMRLIIEQHGDVERIKTYTDNIKSVLSNLKSYQENHALIKGYELLNNKCTLQDLKPLQEFAPKILDGVLKMLSFNRAERSALLKTEELLGEARFDALGKMLKDEELNKAEYLKVRAFVDFDKDVVERYIEKVIVLPKELDKILELGDFRNPKIFELGERLGELRPMLDNLKSDVSSLRKEQGRGIIKNKFLIDKATLTFPKKNQLGIETNTCLPTSQTLFREKVGMVFQHFNVVVEDRLIVSGVPSIKSKIKGKFTKLKNQLSLDMEAIELILEVAPQIYKGNEAATDLREYIEWRDAALSSPDVDLYLWDNLKALRPLRDVIEAFVKDTQKDGIEVGAGKYKNMVDPENYHQTNAIVTKAMEAKHLKIIQEKGIETALYRKHATIPELNVNDMLFVNNSTSTEMKDGIAGLFDKGVTQKATVGDVRDIMSPDDFIANILPHATDVSLMVPPSMSNKLFTLIAPKYSDAKNIQKWSNPYSWSYNGNLADSKIKEEVKKGGGFTDGDLRFSIMWNESLIDRSNDLDAHCEFTAKGATSLTEHIAYSNKGITRDNSGNKFTILDADTITPGDKVAIENITWRDKKFVEDGEYVFYVRDFSGDNRDGFKAQMHVFGDTYDYSFPHSMVASKSTRDVKVAKVTVVDNQATIEHLLPAAAVLSKAWGLTTHDVVTVNAIMWSPNYWGENKVGNKHLFIVLKGCENPDNIRGLYNEFLSSEFRELRKSVDMLARLAVVEHNANQVSGLGFSETLPIDLTFIVKGKNGINGTYRVVNSYVKV